VGTTPRDPPGAHRPRGRRWRWARWPGPVCLWCARLAGQWSAVPARPGHTQQLGGGDRRGHDQPVRAERSEPRSGGLDGHRAAELAVVRVSGRPLVLCFLGCGGAFGGGDLAVDLGLVSVAGRAATLLGPPETLEALALARLGGAFALVGSALPIVGSALALVGDAVPARRRCGRARPPLARVRPTFTPRELALAPRELGRVNVLVLVRVPPEARPEAKCSRLSAQEPGTTTTRRASTPALDGGRR
jgi:hypothetical protein